jgi:hypothetical protein
MFVTLTAEVEFLRDVALIPVSCAVNLIRSRPLFWTGFAAGKNVEPELARKINDALQQAAQQLEAKGVDSANTQQVGGEIWRGSLACAGRVRAVPDRRNDTGDEPRGEDSEPVGRLVASRPTGAEVHCRGIARIARKSHDGRR